MHTIQVKVYATAVHDLNLSYVVYVTGPIEMPPRFYKIGLHEVLERCRRPKDEIGVLLKILEKLIVNDYNAMVDNSPIMDMLDNPTKYTNLHHVEFTELTLK